MYLKFEATITLLFIAVCIIDAEEDVVLIDQNNTLLRNKPEVKSEKIIGGEVASNEEAPYHVYIKVAGQYICGGTLITPQHVLTAAHCLADVAEHPYLPLTVTAGTDSRDEPGVEKRATDIYIHPNFGGILPKHDIGIIKLKEPFEESESIKPASLPKESVKDGETVKITGYGRFSPYTFRASNQLKKLTSKSINCDNFIGKYLGLVGDNDLCIKNPPGEGICSGDSGGPLVNSKGEVVGIASRVFGCAERTPDIYTGVHPYLNFINAVINGTVDEKEEKEEKENAEDDDSKTYYGVFRYFVFPRRFIIVFR